MQSSVNVRLMGNWYGAKAAIRELPRDLRWALINGQRAVAKKLIKQVKGHIDSNDLGWAPLSSRTNTLSSRILVNRGDYYRAITWWQKDYKINVGVKQGATNHKGNSIANIARYHEYGTSRMPARPLWGPSYQNFGGDNQVKSTLIKYLHRRLKKRGWHTKDLTPFIHRL